MTSHFVPDLSYSSLLPAKKCTQQGSLGSGRADLQCVPLGGGACKSVGGGLALLSLPRVVWAESQVASLQSIGAAAPLSV